MGAPSYDHGEAPPTDSALRARSSLADRRRPSGSDRSGAEAEAERRRKPRAEAGARTTSSIDDRLADIEAASTETPFALVVRGTEHLTAIQEAGFDVVNVDRDEDVTRLIGRLSPDIVIIVQSSADDTDETLGLVTAARRASRRAGMPVVLVRGDGVHRREGVDDAERAYLAGATDVWLGSAGPVILKQRLRFLMSATRAFDELHRSSARLERAQRLARFATWEWSLATDRVRWSSELRHLLSTYGPETSGVDGILEMVHPADRTRVESYIVEAIRNRTSLSFDHRALRTDGVELMLHQEADVELDDAGEVASFDGFAVDVTALKRAEVQIHSLANYDRLTGLPNRLSFLDLVTHALDRSERRPGSVAVALIDIDRFKDINESLGHSAGDQLLQDVAQRLVGCLRKGDFIARENDGMVARRGGDEFLMLLTDIEEAHHVAAAARRLLDSLRRPFRVNGKEVHVTGSIGIAMSDDADAHAEDLVSHAEIAMYSAKTAGRNTFQYFDEPMNRTVIERFDMESRLRRAIAREELTLFYQPLVNARTRTFVGVEALLRWNHPTRGLLAADEFVPLAEETGIIITMGRWVLRTACEQVARWHAQGYGKMRLAVNLSPREIRSPGFVKNLVRILDDTGVQPNQVELEITERSVMQNDQPTLDVLVRLREMGIRLAVDDFGTGHTTFHYLKHFPLDTLKIDKSFTRGITVDDKDAAITKALLAMAHRLHLNVVAEGVENEAQLSFLGEHRCDEVQGYLFGRPIPASELANALREHAIAL